MGATRRTKRIEALIRAELAELLLRRVKDPRLKEATLTGVDVSPDLSQAKVFFSVLHEDKRDEVEKGFKAAAAFLRRELAARLELKVMPQILPVYDSSLHKGARMAALIDKVCQKDAADAGLAGESSGPQEKPA